MADATSVELLYSGTDVDDGTVPVEDMVDALVGFSGAYSKLARDRESPDEGHRIRVVGLQKGSARIFVDVIEWVTKNPAAAGVLVTGGSMRFGVSDCSDRDRLHKRRLSSSPSSGRSEK